MNHDRQMWVQSLYEQRDSMEAILSSGERSSDPYLLGMRDGYVEAILALECNEFQTLEPQSESLWRLAQSTDGQDRRYFSGKSESLMRAVFWLGIG